MFKLLLDKLLRGDAEVSDSPRLVNGFVPRCCKFGAPMVMMTPVAGGN